LIPFFRAPKPKPTVPLTASGENFCVWPRSRGCRKLLIADLAGRATFCKERRRTKFLPNGPSQCFIANSKSTSFGPMESQRLNRDWDLKSDEIGEPVGFSTGRSTRDVAEMLMAVGEDYGPEQYPGKPRDFGVLSRPPSSSPRVEFENGTHSKRYGNRFICSRKRFPYRFESNATFGPF